MSYCLVVVGRAHLVWLELVYERERALQTLNLAPSFRRYRAVRDRCKVFHEKTKDVFVTFPELSILKC